MHHETNAPGRMPQRRHGCAAKPTANLSHGSSRTFAGIEGIEGNRTSLIALDQTLNRRPQCRF
jgi:hypothetical protein